MIMLSAVRAVLAWLSNLPAWLAALAVAIFVALTDLGKDLYCWLLDQALGLATSILASLPGDFSQFDPSQWFAALPPEVVSIAGYLHFPAIMLVIVSALIIRFFLQLIPFVRLGS